LKRFLATSDCSKIAILQSFVEDGMKKGEAMIGDTQKKIRMVSAHHPYLFLQITAF
jgi:hypothetical protein